MKAELVSNAPQFQKFWSKIQLWNRLSSRTNLPIFTLHDGPPYANGNIHLGHALNKILKDFILRYRALKGFCLDYLPGWDTHGLPIENKIEKEDEYKNSDPLQKRESCRKYALSQMENQRTQFLQLNLLHDFQSHYKTLDPEFIKFELNAFKSLMQQELIYWDLKPVAWSWSSQTALAEMEIIYKDIQCKSIYFWFPLDEDVHLKNHTLKKGTRLLIWTTTPYTLEANLAVAVHADFTYSLIKTPEGIEYLMLQDMIRELELEGEEIGNFLGEELKNAHYFNPITKQRGKVLIANFITKDTGTGIVHMAPGYGLEDYYACLKEEIAVYVSIDKHGKFIPNTKFKPINGLFYQKASEIIISWMNENGYIYREKVITHSVGHDWRTEKPLIYLASPQWFINIKKLKPQIKKAFENRLNSSPHWLGKRLEELILKREEWCLSRQRLWGTPIPILFDENKKPILNLKQIEKNIEILSKEGLDVWFKEDGNYFLHPELREKYGNQKLTKSQDILDVWFDSGCSWGILKSNSAADIYLEGFDQLRGWFNSSASISIALKNQLPFKSLISHGFVLDKNGNKMSKSKGNVVDPIEFINKYGADVLRLWIGFNNYLEDIKISEESIENAISLYRKIRNTILRYSLSILPKNFEIDWEVLNRLSQPENIYIYQTFRECLLQIKENLDKHLFFKSIKHSISFINIYSGWYLEICKDCLYCDPIDSPNRREIINIVGVVFEQLLFFFSIFLPQTAEDAWFHRKNSNDSSIFLHTWPELKGENYEVNEKIWNDFWKLKNEVYILVEQLKNQGAISSSSSVKLILPKNRYIKSLNLLKLLNLGEIEEGENLSIAKSTLAICQRCRRHHPDLSPQQLCSRCQHIISSWTEK